MCLAFRITFKMNRLHSGHMWTAFPVSRSVVRNVGNLIILKAKKADVVCRQWAGLRDPSLRTAKNTGFNPLTPAGTRPAARRSPAGSTRWSTEARAAAPLPPRLITTFLSTVNSP